MNVLVPPAVGVVGFPHALVAGDLLLPPIVVVPVLLKAPLPANPFTPAAGLPKPFPGTVGLPKPFAAPLLAPKVPGKDARDTRSTYLNQIFCYMR